MLLKTVVDIWLSKNQFSIWDNLHIKCESCENSNNFWKIVQFSDCSDLLNATFGVILQAVQPSPLSNSRTIHHPKRNPQTHSQSLPAFCLWFSLSGQRRTLWLALFCWMYVSGLRYSTCSIVYCHEIISSCVTLSLLVPSPKILTSSALSFPLLSDNCLCSRAQVPSSETLQPKFHPLFLASTFWFIWSNCIF